MLDAIYVAAHLMAFLILVAVWIVEDWKAGRAGMVRPVRGLVVTLTNDSIEVVSPGKRPMTLARCEVTRALYVHDDLFERPAGRADTLTLYSGETSKLSIPETAAGFHEAFVWARRSVPFEVKEVKLSA